MLTRRQRLNKAKKRLLHRLLPRRQPPIVLFVGGEQRSGTNFLFKAIEQSHHVECYLEVDQEAFDDYVLRDMTIIDQLVTRTRASVVGFKAICDSQNFQSYLDHFPEGRVIWAFRHYDDVVNSSLRNFSEHRRYLEKMLFEPGRAGWRVQNVPEEEFALVRRFYEKGIDDASARALIWLLRNRQLFRQSLDGDKRVYISWYERLVENPSAEFRMIFDFLGISHTQRAAEAASTSSVKKNPPPQIDGDVRALCDDMYERLIQIRQAGAR